MAGTSSNTLSDAIAALPQLLQEPTTLWFERLAAQHGSPALPDAATAQLARVVACSEFAAGVVLREWDWFAASYRSFV